MISFLAVNVSNILLWNALYFKLVMIHIFCCLTISYAELVGGIRVLVSKQVHASNTQGPGLLPLSDLFVSTVSHIVMEKAK